MPRNPPIPNHPFELATHTTGMVTSKLVWNSTISTKGSCFASTNIKNMSLNTPLDWYEYTKMPLSLFLKNIIKHYGILDKVLNCYVYMEICKGMYVLPQVGILANKLLKKHIVKQRYYEQPHTPSLWKHSSHQI
jgi:hypothetical protein